MNDNTLKISLVGILYNKTIMYNVENIENINLKLNNFNKCQC